MKVFSIGEIINIVAALLTLGTLLFAVMTHKKDKKNKWKSLRKMVVQEAKENIYTMKISKEFSELKLGTKHLNNLSSSLKNEMLKKYLSKYNSFPIPSNLQMKKNKYRGSCYYVCNYVVRQISQLHQLSKYNEEDQNVHLGRRLETLDRHLKTLKDIFNYKAVQFKKDEIIEEIDETELNEEL